MSPGSSLELVDDFEDASEEEQPDDGSQRFYSLYPVSPRWSIRTDAAAKQVRRSASAGSDRM